MGLDACKPNPGRERMMEFSRLSKSAIEYDKKGWPRAQFVTKTPSTSDMLRTLLRPLRLTCEDH